MKDVYCTKIDNARPQKSATEYIDREILWSMRQKKPIRLDKAFPDIGLFENDTRSCAIAPAVKKRMRSMRGKGYQKEFIYRTIHRLALRGISSDMIADMFNVHVKTVEKWLRELSKLNQPAIMPNPFLQDTLDYYNEVRDTGMAMATTLKTTKERLKGLEIALKAENDKQRFLNQSGLFEDNKLTEPVFHDPMTHQASKLNRLMSGLLNDPSSISEYTD